MKLRPFPKHGDTRTRTRFAWLPVTLDDGTRIWLERYGERWEWRCDELVWDFERRRIIAKPERGPGYWRHIATFALAPAMGRGWEVSASGVKDPQPPSGGSGVGNP